MNVDLKTNKTKLYYKYFMIIVDTLNLIDSQSTIKSEKKVYMNSNNFKYNINIYYFL
jgi:hypothetical protein